MKKIFILLIHFYRLCFSPFIGRSCRFYPSCSEYACEALEKKGLFKGLWLIACRLLKCHPWHPGGYNPLD